MKYIFSLFITALFFYSCNNSIEDTANDYCNCLEANKMLPFMEQTIRCDSILNNLYDVDDSEEDIAHKNIQLNSILNNNCNQYQLVVNQVNIPDLKNLVFNERLGRNAKSNLPVTLCQEFKEFTNFYYFESNGDTTFLKIQDDIWIDSFSNEKYESYLKINWISDCEFQLELIYTTEPKRKAIFKKGDLFNYRIMDKKKDHYNMIVFTKQMSQSFNLYFR